MAIEKPVGSVLVVDDDEFNRLVLVTLLTKRNFQVSQAVNGLDAVEKYQQNHPDFVFMDVLMPEMDGYEAAKAIKKLAAGRFVPIIFLTSLTDENDLARCVEAGGDDFLTKPFSEVILTSKMRAFERTRELYSTVQRQHEILQTHHQQLLDEEKAARKIYNRIVNPESLDKPYFRYVVSPLMLFNGDLLLMATAPNGNIHVLLGDATGHGLPAALCALPVSELFYRHTQSGYAMPSILSAIDNKLKDILTTGYFLCAAAVEYDIENDIVRVWNAGMPDVVLYRREKHETKTIESSVVPLGIVKKNAEEFAPFETKRSGVDMLYLYTDGVIETQNEQDELYGRDRLIKSIGSFEGDGSLLDNIISDVRTFQGEKAQSDDFTIIEIDFRKLESTLALPKTAVG